MRHPASMKKLIIIAGPTASGKTAVSIELAKRLGGEIISADSMQVYRGMDIGSAKVRKDEMNGVPHHLIDIINPKDPWNVVLFQQKAEAAALEISERGRLPFLVGGTGFYIQALLYGIDFTKTEEDSAFRREMEAIARSNGPLALHELLRKEDPEAAQQIHPNNIKRVIRALEFKRQTGQCISLHNEAEHQKRPVYDAVFFVLSPPREVLYRRIDERVDRMMRDGLPEEVRRLYNAGLREEDVSMQGLGYRQLIRYLDGRDTLEEAVRQIKIQTRHFAKRQLTWFHRERGVIWIDPCEFSGVQALAGRMEEMIEEHYHMERKHKETV